jgi:hypothetical protein
VTGGHRHLVVIGGQRCGTTYLADLLEAHPDVALASPRRPEPKVFLSDEVLARGHEWYVETWFADRGSARVLAEKSTSYIDHPDAAARIDRVLDEPLVLAQVREPVARAVSHWRFSAHHGVEHRSLHDALAESLVQERAWDPETYSVSPFAYVSRGDYAAALRPWVERFGERLRVQFMDEVVSGEAVDDLFAWMGLPPPQHKEREPANESPGEEPEIGAELLQRLHEHFAPRDQALRELLGRSLPWDDTRHEGAR